jgi:hypothetical protein
MINSGIKNNRMLRTILQCRTQFSGPQNAIVSIFPSSLPVASDIFPTLNSTIFTPKAVGKALPIDKIQLIVGSNDIFLIDFLHN